MKEPRINVGILSGDTIEFTLSSVYICHGTEVSGKQRIEFDREQLLWNGQLFNELTFEPIDKNTGTFELHNVTIGIDFHWERKENQRFKGTLKIIQENHTLTAVNIIETEDYLTSVISSEMSASASLELLKAHAVISRSWLLSQIRKDKHTTPKKTSSSDFIETEKEHICWYNHEDHSNFDVCADDHCQRYQGVSRAYTEKVMQAIDMTRGEVLTFEGEICDARFSKCCGGILEEFSCCWEDIRYPYLCKTRDSKQTASIPDLTQEKEAEKWIRSCPEAFCRTDNPEILRQVLNNYDQETTDFYRWKITYSQTELSDLISRKSGLDFGKIIKLEPLSRGTSGRIWKLRITGTKHSLIVGKELEIRRILSPTHLYSSAFIVETGNVTGNIPDSFTFIGAGWGHGVGLCQIGAAVMGEQGFGYDTILRHYYPGTIIKKLYQ